MEASGKKLQVTPLIEEIIIQSTKACVCRHQAGQRRVDMDLEDREWRIRSKTIFLASVKMNDWEVNLNYEGGVWRKLQLN